jgi:hypothetical protein
MRASYPMHRAPRCLARTRRDTLCQTAAMANGRCRMHGGASLSGRQHGRYRTGFHTRAAIAERRRLRELMAECRDFTQRVLGNAPRSAEAFR